MTIERSTGVIVVLSLVIVLLLWALTYFARDEYQGALGERVERASSPNVSQVEGRATVRVSPEAQRAGGLGLQELRPWKLQPSAEVHGFIASVKPLLEARARFLAAQAELRALRSSAANSERERERLKSLFEDDRNVSERALREAEAAARSNSERANAAQQNLAGIEAAARADWGAALAEAALDSRSGSFASLAQGRELLAQVAIPHEYVEGIERMALTLMPAGQDARVAARYVSPAPHAPQALPGAAFFYRVSAAGFAAGMRVSGELKLPGATSEGVIVPERAVVWHAGRAWCYVKRGEDGFVRMPVATRHAVEHGWFNATGFDAHREVVVVGAQLLLSEELKYQIRNENVD